MRKSVIIAGGALAVAGLAVPAGAQTNVTVKLAQDASSRTLHVENLAGEQLTELDFGASRSLPFRVRVVDGSMARESFSVSATMTKLYGDNSGTTDYERSISSGNLSVGSLASPLSVFGVSAAVQPLVDTVSTITSSTICTTLKAVVTVVDGVSACRPRTSNLTGSVQEVAVPVDLANLANLPLLPQAPEHGAFTNPDYLGVGANDPNKPADFTPTSRRMLAGSPVSTNAVLAALHAPLVTKPIGSLVPRATVVGALQSEFPLTWPLLSTAEVDSVLAATVGTVQPLLPGQVLSQTGTYMSLPSLNAAAPANVASGTYKGTLVVTALQP